VELAKKSQFVRRPDHQEKESFEADEADEGGKKPKTGKRECISKLWKILSGVMNTQNAL